MPDDAELIREFGSTRSEPAFAELYRRHSSWVYAVARRMVRDSELAGDVTQAVFIVLARKAPRLSESGKLTAWLFTTTRLTAKAALRAEGRRRKHEERAAQMKRQTGTSVDVELLDQLDDVVATLRPADQQAILLRFYQQKTYEEVAMSLGISADACRKRLERAMVQLQGLFA